MASGPFALATDRAAGGLIAYEPVAVTLVSQDLSVSPEQITVTYLLRSSAPQQARLAFPMPPVPIESGPDFLGGAEINDADPRNYMEFSARADGIEVQPQIIETAYVGEVDVSDMLRAAGLPLLPPPDSISDLIAGLAGEQFYPLEENHIVSRGGDDPPHFSPLWSYQATLAWQQSFPPGETKIEINYRPFANAVSDPLEFLNAPAMASKYCFGNDVAKRAGERAEVVTVGYLLAMTPFAPGQSDQLKLGVQGSGDRAIPAYCSPAPGPGSRVDVAFIYPDGLP